MVSGCVAVPSIDVVRVDAGSVGCEASRLARLGYTCVEGAGVAVCFRMLGRYVEHVVVVLSR